MLRTRAGAMFAMKESAPWVLRRVDFKCAVEACIALVGGNGSGKTTLLKLVAKAGVSSKGQSGKRPRGRAGPSAAGPQGAFRLR